MNMKEFFFITLTFVKIIQNLYQNVDLGGLYHRTMFEKIGL